MLLTDPLPSGGAGVGQLCVLCERFLCGKQKLLLKRMSLYISSLNTGSNGNCFYIGNDNEAILIDAGISCRETERRMKRLGLLMEKVKAIFVSHEHSDHISGIPVLA